MDYVANYVIKFEITLSRKLRELRGKLRDKIWEIYVEKHQIYVKKHFSIIKLFFHGNYVDYVANYVINLREKPIFYFVGNSIYWNE